MSYEPLDQPMPDPDWGRVLVNTAQKKAPSGDPTLWANTITTLIDNDEAGIGDVRYGAQIVLAQAADRYARSWSVSGALTLTNSAWDEAVNPAFLPPDGLVVDAYTGTRPSMAVYLSITQGIEKVTLEHQICLMYGGSAGNVGLCNNQCTINGGPYLPIATKDVSGADAQTRAFAAIGSLIGNTISVRGVFVRSGNDGTFAVASATISLLLTPHAAGSGI